MREIARAAGQKNPSALHYHFGNREALLAALAARRLLQLEARRIELLKEATAETTCSDLHKVCQILVGAPFYLCREDASFRDFLGVFGLHLLASDRDYFEVELSQEASSLIRLWERATQSISRLPPEILALRMENAHGAALLAMSRRAHRRGSFRGRHAELFFHNLVDQIAAMVSAPVSEQTHAKL